MEKRQLENLIVVIQANETCLMVGASCQGTSRLHVCNPFEVYVSLFVFLYLSNSVEMYVCIYIKKIKHSTLMMSSFSHWGMHQDVSIYMCFDK